MAEHLTAYRMEKLYAETMALFGVTDELPAGSQKVIIGPKDTYMGYGLLGMRDKYLLLVTEKEATHRDSRRSSSGGTQFLQRWYRDAARCCSPAPPSRTTSRSNTTRRCTARRSTQPEPARRLPLLRLRPASLDQGRLRSLGLRRVDGQGELDQNEGPPRT